MKRIVILGCENSHADGFLRFIKECPDVYGDIQVVGVFSEEREAAEKLHDKFGVSVMNSYDEAVGMVDGVVVTARHGAKHYEYAKPYIKSGVPMFIDKPITIDEDEAIRFMRECRDAGNRLTGGSSCLHAEWVQQLRREHNEGIGGKTLGGYLRAPLHFGSVYGGFYFYAEHLVGVTSEIFGRYPKSVKAFRNGATLTVIFRYDDFDVTGVYVEGSYCYYAARSSESGVKGSEYPVDDSCFKTEFSNILSLLNGGEQKISYDDMIAPVFVMNAISRSLESGEECKVKEFKV